MTNLIQPVLLVSSYSTKDLQVDMTCSFPVITMICSNTSSQAIFLSHCLWPKSFTLGFFSEAESFSSFHYGRLIVPLSAFSSSKSFTMTHGLNKSCM